MTLTNIKENWIVPILCVIFTLFVRNGTYYYAEVLSGCHMPDLMYMTTFNNISDRDAHWKAFGDSPAWKTLSALPEYQHTVSTANIYLLHPTSFSDF